MRSPRLIVYTHIFMEGDIFSVFMLEKSLIDCVEPLIECVKGTSLLVESFDKLLLCH